MKTPFLLPAVLISLSLLVCGTAQGAATELGIKDTQFTLNGEPTFLLGISYYGALGASEDFIRRDLDDAQRHGFNWIRVFATWSFFGNDVSAVDEEGKAREPFLGRLKWLIAECDRRGMAVDVTLMRDKGTTGTGRLPTLAAHRRAVETLVAALKPQRNWYLDLANERNIPEFFTSLADVKTLRDAAKKLDPQQLITASHSGDISREDLREYLNTVQVDFISPHRPRHAQSPAQTAAKSREYLAWMKETGRSVPLHYQEPLRSGWAKWQPKAADFITDLNGARAGGAAGWCFHNGDQSDKPDGNPRRSFDLREQQLFEQFDDEERKVLAELKAVLTTALPVPTHTVESSAQRLEDYRVQLDTLRKAYGGTRDLPEVRFFLFGMGARTKLLYRDGILFEARTGRELHRWKVRREIIVPPDYSVLLQTEDGGTVTLREDSEAVWLEEDGRRSALKGTQSSVKLPEFAGKKYPLVLRVLHQELLVNLVEAGPMPNFFVYEKPWYRDGAMVALALKETGNIDLLKPWILGLREPFDRNNNGETEADNLGQALFLVSLVSDKNHPLVAKVLAEVPRFEKTTAVGKHIVGRSDFAEHPVYQTKWLKYGLRALGLPDDYVIPRVVDPYSALFWMDYREQHVAGKDNDNRGPYPYLGWACDHFHGTRKSPLSNRDYPLTWEENASQARYAGLEIVSPHLVKKKISPPHTWHAAEAFLLLLTEQASESR